MTIIDTDRGSQLGWLPATAESAARGLVPRTVKREGSRMNARAGAERFDGDRSENRAVRPTDPTSRRRERTMVFPPAVRSVLCVVSLIALCATPVSAEDPAW